MEDRQKPWLLLVEQGEAPDDYSPRVKAALAIYFASMISGEDVSIADIARASGVSAPLLYRYIKGIKKKMKSIIDSQLLRAKASELATGGIE
jgi:AcrR family transcriptional regulator